MYCALQPWPQAGGLRDGMDLPAPAWGMSNAIVLGMYVYSLLEWSCTDITMQGMYTSWHKIFITSCEGTNNTELGGAFSQALGQTLLTQHLWVRLAVPLIDYRYHWSHACKMGMPQPHFLLATWSIQRHVNVQQRGWVKQDELRNTVQKQWNLNYELWCTKS